MYKRRILGTLLGLTAGVVGAGAAIGQEEGTPLPDPTTPDYYPLAPPSPQALPPAAMAPPLTAILTSPDRWQPRSRIGMALTLGGGVGDFSNDSINATTGMAGSWNLRLSAGTRLPFAWEVAYIGGANDVTGAGTGADEYLLRNGAEGGLRFNVPFVWRSGMFEPFAAGGIGWTRYTTVNDDGAGVSGQDDVLVVPVGGGLAMSIRGVTAEARFTYRLAYADEMFDERDMGNWNLALGLGMEF
jgi:hypothetical protein